jgi:hypothetical protein
VISWAFGCGSKRWEYNKTCFYITIVSEHIDSAAKKKRKHTVKMNRAGQDQRGGEFYQADQISYISQ